MWYTQGDSGDSQVHSIKPFKDYTAAEIAAMPVNSDGVRIISLTVGQNDVGGAFTPIGPGGSGSGGAHFSALAYDSNTGKLIQTSSGSTVSYDPITGANQAIVSGFGNGFADGLDSNGTNKWFSPDAGNIFLNTALFASTGNAAQLVSVANGGITNQSAGWSGVEQVGNDVYAVAVLTGADTGNSRIIVRFDLSGNLVGFDPDGDSVAARWEDLGSDGTYLYAADLRGNADGSFVGDVNRGDIYVFQVTGGLSGCGNPGQPPCTNNVPEPSTLPLMGLGLGAAIFGMMRRRKSN